MGDSEVTDTNNESRSVGACIDYCATGEGRIIWLFIARSTLELDRLLEKEFGPHFGYFEPNLERFEGRIPSAVADSLPGNVLKFLREAEPCHFEYVQRFHFNYS